MSLLLLLRTLFTPTPDIPPGDRSVIAVPHRRTAQLQASRSSSIRSMNRGATITDGRTSRVETHRRTARPA